MRRVVRRIWIGAGCLAMIALVWSFQAHDVSDEFLRSGKGVVVRRGVAIEFMPERTDRKAGLIIYPGGMVDPNAYAPMAHRLAREGFPVRVVKLPWRSAVLESQRELLFDRTEEMLSSNPPVRWALAGHSRGGALATQFIQERGLRVTALVLIATTHLRDFDLSKLGMPVVKIYATNDGVATHGEMQKNADLLPPDMRWIGIAGGNHAQFGSYGPQLGDGRATISRQRQQEELLVALREALTDVEKRTPSAPPEARRYTAPRHASIRAASLPPPVPRPRLSVLTTRRATCRRSIR